MHPDHDASHTWVTVTKYPYAFAQIVFSFGGHSVFPTIEDSMRNPKNFNAMFNLSFITVMILYLPPAIVGYWAYGSAVNSPVLLSLPSGVATDIAVIAITLHTLVVIPIICNPIALAIEGVLQIESRSLIPGKIGPSAVTELIYRVIIRAILLAAQAAVAIAVPHFPDLMDLVGATCVTAVVFLVPCAIHLKTRWKKIPYYELAWIAAVLWTGMIGGSIGMYTSLVQLYFDLFTNSSPDIPDKVFYLILAVACVIAVAFLAILFGWIVMNKLKLKDRSADREVKLSYAPVNTSTQVN